MNGKSIKETKEILEGVKHLAKAGKKIRDIVGDGVDASDLPKAFQLIKDQADNMSVYEAAIKDAKLAKEELKDLEKDEILELLFIVVDGISEVEKS